MKAQPATDSSVRSVAPIDVPTTMTMNNNNRNRQLMMLEYCKFAQERGDTTERRPRPLRCQLHDETSLATPEASPDNLNFPYPRARKLVQCSTHSAPRGQGRKPALVG